MRRKRGALHLLFSVMLSLISHRSEQHSSHTVPACVSGDSNTSCFLLSYWLLSWWPAAWGRSVLREWGTLQIEGKAVDRAANFNNLCCTRINGCISFQAQLFLAVCSLAICMSQHCEVPGQCGWPSVFSDIG